MRDNRAGDAFERNLSGIASISILYIYICLKKKFVHFEDRTLAIATRSMENYVRFHARKRLFPLSDIICIYIYYVTLFFSIDNVGISLYVHTRNFVVI